MSCAADRDDFRPWAGKTAAPREGSTPEVNATKLAARLVVHLDRDGVLASWPAVLAELESALDQEYRSGVEEAREAIGAALRYRPISPDEVA